MKHQKLFHIICEHCITIVGTVYEDENPVRPGFFTNRCVPDPMPTKCETCNTIVTRATGVLTK